MQQVLLSGTTSLEDLKRLKTIAGEAVESNTSPVEQAVATAIYFAAIASSLVFHQRKIATRSHSDLAAGLGKLIDQPWLPRELAEHYAKAKTVCEAHTD